MEKEPFVLNCGVVLCSLHPRLVFGGRTDNENRKETCTEKGEKQDHLPGHEKIYKDKGLSGIPQSLQHIKSINRIKNKRMWYSVDISPLFHIEGLSSNLTVALKTKQPQSQGPEKSFVIRQ